MRHRELAGERISAPSGAELSNRAAGPDASLLFFTGLARPPLWLGVPHVEEVSRYRFTIESQPSVGQSAERQMRAELRTSTIPLQQLDLQPGGFYQWCVEGAGHNDSPWTQLASGIFWMVDAEGQTEYKAIRAAFTRAPDMEFAALAASTLFSRIGLYNDCITLIGRRTGEPVQAGRERLRHLALALVYANMTSRLETLLAAGGGSAAIPLAFLTWSRARSERHRALAAGDALISSSEVDAVAGLVRHKMAAL